MKALHVGGHVALFGIFGCAQPQSAPPRPQARAPLPVAHVEPQPAAPNPLLALYFAAHRCPGPVNQPVEVWVGPPNLALPPPAGSAVPAVAMAGESTLGEVCKYESGEADSLVMRDPDWRGGKLVRRTTFNLRGNPCRGAASPCDRQDPLFAVSTQACDQCAELNATAVDKAKSASGLFARTVTGGLVHSTRMVPLMQYDLRESLDKALLTVTAHGDDLKTFAKLKQRWSRRYVGERVTESQTTTLYLHAIDPAHAGGYFLDDDAKTLEVSCMQTQLAVAGPGAILFPKVSSRSVETECGDSSAVWRPEKRQEHPAYVCSVSRINGKAVEDPQPHMVFTPNRSIEQVEVNNDCDMQGSGFRLIANPARVARMHATGDGY